MSCNGDGSRQLSLAPGYYQHTSAGGFLPQILVRGPASVDPHPQIPSPWFRLWGQTLKVTINSNVDIPQKVSLDTFLLWWPIHTHSKGRTLPADCLYKSPVPALCPWLWNVMKSHQTKTFLWAIEICLLVVEVSTLLWSYLCERLTHSLCIQLGVYSTQGSSWLISWTDWLWGAGCHFQGLIRAPPNTPLFGWRASVPLLPLLIGRESCLSYGPATHH